MDRDVPEDRDDTERLDVEPAERDDEVVYADTDLNPNAEDQADAHRG